MGQTTGRKGMGLIMLILVGTVPTAYALNHTVDQGVGGDVRGGVDCRWRATWGTMFSPGSVVGDAGPELEKFVASHKFQPSTMLALQQMVVDIRNEAVSYGSLGDVPQNMQANVRNQMYLVSDETMRLLPKFGPKISSSDQPALTAYKGFLDKSTKYIPTWVKVAVALALGLGTMIGWKRIVITVGEKIGKTHLTYAQGASAELVAMCTIFGFRPDRAAGVDDACAELGCGGDDGGERERGCRCRRCGILRWRGCLRCRRRLCLSGSLFWVFNAMSR